MATRRAGKKRKTKEISLGSFQIETRVKQTERAVGGAGGSNLDGLAEFPLKHGLGG